MLEAVSAKAETIPLMSMVASVSKTIQILLLRRKTALETGSTKGNTTRTVLPIRRASAATKLRTSSAKSSGGVSGELGISSPPFARQTLPLPGLSLSTTAGGTVPSLFAFGPAGTTSTGCGAAISSWSAPSGRPAASGSAAVWDTAAGSASSGWAGLASATAGAGSDAPSGASAGAFSTGCEAGMSPVCGAGGSGAEAPSAACEAVSAIAVSVVLAGFGFGVTGTGSAEASEAGFAAASSVPELAASCVS